MKRLRQSDVAAAVGVKTRRISDYENDLAQPDASLLPHFARVLGLSLRLLQKLLVPNDPVGDFAELFRVRKPLYLPKGDQPTWRRMRALWRRDPGLFNPLWGMLGRRVDWANVRKFLVDVQADCADEVLVLFRLLLGLDTTPARLAPQTYGFRTLPIIHHKSGELVGDCRVPALVRRGRHPAVLFPQPTMLTSTGPARPDALVGVRTKGGMVWCAAEYDGARHDVSRDATRSADLKMPVVRFTAAEVRSAGFSTLFWERIHRAAGVA